ncbi:MAG: AbrB/MazE/SpoVT family DNA-binding domain-containing protein [Solirubrobacteraceae bacterium]|nr:AbrB/MazE/SpoVT family DNA-binding domain-containing protein [Solirubrobacteraceae bacterium]
MPRISSKNQVTLPVAVLEAVGLKAGDEVVIEPDDGGIVVRRRARDPRAGFGVFDGLYPPGYLEDLRKDWRR